MFKLAFFALVICLGISCIKSEEDQGVNWALLIAGSNEFYNYRHQADICHAYQILHKNGIPDERIIVMMYDDIADNEENPNKGVIINRPNGPNVYNGTVKDYTKDEVTPANFLKVLQGQPMKVGSKKVLKSGPNDNVFVYFSDHGAPGLIAFPDGSALHAKDLNKAIKDMHTQNKFKNMVLYIEACESGSMFEKLLPNNINVYATTAANSDESSYACYFDDDLQTYLGDLYSVNWMEDSDSENIKRETLLKQFQITKSETNESHVQQFGNLTMGKAFFVADFQAEKSSYVNRKPINIKYDKTDRVKSEDVQVSILEKRMAKATSPLRKKIIFDQIRAIDKFKKMTELTMKQIVTEAVKGLNLVETDLTEKKMELNNHECYAPVVDKLIEKCFSLKNEHALRNLYMLVNLCESNVAQSKILEAIEKACSSLNQ